MSHVGSKRQALNQKPEPLRPERETVAIQVRGCFRLWLRRYTEMLRNGKLNMEDRSVENKLVEAIFKSVNPELNPEPP